jgi:hypothetical protein
VDKERVVDRRIQNWTGITRGQERGLRTGNTERGIGQEDIHGTDKLLVSFLPPLTTELQLRVQLLDHQAKFTLTADEYQHGFIS